MHLDYSSLMINISLLYRKWIYAKAIIFHDVFLENKNNYSGHNRWNE